MSPSFSVKGVAGSMNHPCFVAVLVGHNKAVGIDDYFPPTVEIVEIEIQYQQAGLCRDKNPHLIADRLVSRADDALDVEEAAGQFPKAVALGGIKSLQHRGLRQRGVPQRQWDSVLT